MIELLLTTVLPALLPAVGDGIKAGINKLTGTAPATPQTVEDAIALMQAQTERLRALAELDKPAGAIAPWVANLRASSRYVAVFILILNGIGQAAWGNDPTVINLSLQMAQSGFFFLFGDRVYLHLKRNT